MNKFETQGLLERLKNSNFILESKMTELNQNKSSKPPNDQMQCENFNLPWKLMNNTFNTISFTCCTEQLF